MLIGLGVNSRPRPACVLFASPESHLRTSRTYVDSDITNDYDTICVRWNN